MLDRNNKLADNVLSGNNLNWTANTFTKQFNRMCIFWLEALLFDHILMQS